MARILDNDLLGDEEYVERTLRPQYFKEYIGQDKVKDQLKIFIEAAKLRDEADRKSTRLNSSHRLESRMPSSA